MITERQRLARTEGIGSSDAAAILGYSPWRTAEDVRLIKTGLVEPEEPGELAEIGTALEDGISVLAARRLNCRLVKPTSTYVHPSGIIRVNVDRQVEKAAKGSRVVEVKDSGLDDGWGDEGTYGVPVYVLIQAVVQIGVVETDKAHVARLGRGFNRGLTMYEIPRDETVEEIWRGARDKLLTWWDKHIERGEPCDPYAKPARWDILKRVRREPKSTVQINSDLIRQWRDDDAAARAASTKADESMRRIVTALGGAEAGKSDIGSVTYLEQTRKEFISPTSTFRVLRFKEAI